MQKSKFGCWPAAGRDLPVFWPSEATFFKLLGPCTVRPARGLAGPDWPSQGGAGGRLRAAVGSRAIGLLHLFLRDVYEKFDEASVDEVSVSSARLAYQFSRPPCQPASLPHRH
jgi:hypothetical protein